MTVKYFKTNMAICTAFLLCFAPATAMAEDHVIEIEGFEFSSDDLDVAIGDTVTWVNRDVAPHTATAVDGSWDSGPLAQGEEWTFTIETAGALYYQCSFHPIMKGVLNAAS